MLISYSQILKKSWQRTKKPSWLWIYGLILTIFGGWGIGSFSQVPQDNILLLALPAFWVILGMIIQSWAKAGLIAGLIEQEKELRPSFFQTAKIGLGFFRRMFTYQILAALLLIGLLSLSFLAAVVPMILIKIEAFRLIWLLIVSLFTLVSLLFLSLAGIYAERLIVLVNYRPWPAFKKALVLGRHNFFATIRLGILNSAIGLGVGIAITLALGLLLGLPVILILSLAAGPGFPFLAFLFLIFFGVNFLAGAWWTVFNYSNWNQLYQQNV